MDIELKEGTFPFIYLSRTIKLIIEIFQKNFLDLNFGGTLSSSQFVNDALFSDAFLCAYRLLTN